MKKQMLGYLGVSDVREVEAGRAFVVFPTPRTGGKKLAYMLLDHDQPVPGEQAVDENGQRFTVKSVCPSESRPDEWVWISTKGRCHYSCNVYVEPETVEIEKSELDAKDAEIERLKAQLKDIRKSAGDDS
jgi:hypothetical protein